MKRPWFDRGIYHAIVTLPDVLYPFKCKIRGQFVRGRRSYERAVNSAFRKYGVGKYGYSLTLYRSVFHIVGSIAVIYAAALLSHDLFGSTVALYVVLVLTALFITYQEFYLQRRIYRQLWRKGILDWFTWVLPISLYVFVLVR